MEKAILLSYRRALIVNLGSGGGCFVSAVVLSPAAVCILHSAGCCIMGFIQIQNARIHRQRQRKTNEAQATGADVMDR
jgi:hypothetical protein